MVCTWSGEVHLPLASGIGLANKHLARVQDAGEPFRIAPGQVCTPRGGDDLGAGRCSHG